MGSTVEENELHRVVVTCLIHNSARKFLIIRRSPLALQFPDVWCVPGGGLSTDDYLFALNSPDGGREGVAEHALRREIEEETKVTVGEFTYVNNFGFIRPDGHSVFGMRFYAPYLSGEVVLDPTDATEYAWIHADEVSKYRLLGNIPYEIRHLDGILQARRF